MLEWKEQFSKIILNRGETYFLQKRVKNLTEKNGSYTAYVVGERGYSVYIGIRDEKITRMSICRWRQQVQAYGSGSFCDR